MKTSAQYIHSKICFNFLLGWKEPIAFNISSEKTHLVFTTIVGACEVDWIEHDLSTLGSGCDLGGLEGDIDWWHACPLLTWQHEQCIYLTNRPDRRSLCRLAHCQFVAHKYCDIHQCHHCSCKIKRHHKWCNLRSPLSNLCSLPKETGLSNHLTFPFVSLKSLV